MAPGVHKLWVLLLFPFLFLFLLSCCTLRPVAFCFSIKASLLAPMSSSVSGGGDDGAAGAGGAGAGASGHVSSSRQHSVAIIGSGNWGSTIARCVARNSECSRTAMGDTRQRVLTLANVVLCAVCSRDGFSPKVSMWVYEEEVNGRKLTEIINTDHENVK